MRRTASTQGSFGLRAATRSCAQVQRCVCLLAAAAPRRAANLFGCASVQLGGCDGNRHVRPQRVQSQSQAEPYSLRLCPSLTGLAVRPAASAQGSSAQPSRTCQAAPTLRRCPPRLCWSTERRLGGAAYHLVSSATTGRGSQPTASPASPRPTPHCCPPSTPIPEASLNPSRRAVQRFPSPSLLTPSAPSSLDPLQSQNGY